MKNRFRLRIAAALGAAAALAVAGMPGTASAQLRRFPPKTLVGRLTLNSFPQATLNGKSVQLAPGVRILSTDNLLVVPSTLSGERVVRYRVDTLGQVIEVWLLSDSEATAALREPGSGS